MPSRRSRLTSDTGTRLRESLRKLRTDLKIPQEFPPDAISEARRAAESVPVDPKAAGTVDLREIPFRTIDPEGSTDLDQALHLGRDGGRVVLHYAIADLPAYVRPGGAIDTVARERGQTLYAPDGRVPLHPQELSEDAASLLPDRDRRAYVWRFELDDRAEPITTTLIHATIRSRAQWSYPDAQRAVDASDPDELFSLLRWFGNERLAREAERGGASLNLPEVDIVEASGSYRLEPRALLPIETWNAHVSLLTGMAAARIMLDGGVGILRTMPRAETADLDAFRRTTVALGLPWREDVDYGSYLRSLDDSSPAALAVREAASTLFRGAGYLAFDGEVPSDPVQSAIAAPYAHVTAPLRRLVDRWSLVVCAALTAGTPVPDWVRTSLPDVPGWMAASNATAGRLEAGAVDRVEAATVSDRIGKVFSAVVTAERKSGMRVQVADPPLVTVVAGLDAEPGSTVELRLNAADVMTGELVFERVDGGTPA